MKANRRRGERQWRKFEDVEVQGVDKEESRVTSVAFQVADVKKPLLAVKRIIEKGNHVTFGPSPEDNYILNKSIGDKMMPQGKGKGSYLMQVKFVGGEKPQSLWTVGQRKMYALGIGQGNCLAPGSHING